MIGPPGDVLVVDLSRTQAVVEQLIELDSPRVVLSITGFGHDGFAGGRARYDQIAQDEGGVMPIRTGCPSARITCGSVILWS